MQRDFILRRPPDVPRRTFEEIIKDELRYCRSASTRKTLIRILERAKEMGDAR